MKFKNRFFLFKYLKFIILLDFLFLSLILSIYFKILINPIFTKIIYKIFLFLIVFIKKLNLYFYYFQTFLQYQTYLILHLNLQDVL